MCPFPDSGGGLGLWFPVCSPDTSFALSLFDTLWVFFPLYISCVTWWRRVCRFLLHVHQAFQAICKSRSTTEPRLPTTKLICSNTHVVTAALSAPMILLCCSFASASFTFRNPSFLFVGHLNSKVYTIRSIEPYWLHTRDHWSFGPETIHA